MQQYTDEELKVILRTDSGKLVEIIKEYYKKYDELTGTQRTDEREEVIEADKPSDDEEEVL